MSGDVSKTTNDTREKAIIGAAQAVVAAWRSGEISRLPDSTSEGNSNAQSAMVRLADALRGYGGCN